MAGTPCLLRLANIVAVVTVATAFIFELFVFCYITLYKVCAEFLSWPVGLVVPLGILGFIPWALALLSFLVCSICDPGYVPDSWRDDVETHHFPMVTEIRRTWQPQLIQICPKCNKKRPERAHHCSFCSKCVLRMDHHCPWIGNCVGAYNHKFFIQFAAYTFLCCIVLICATIPSFVTLLRREDIDEGVGASLYVLYLLGFLGLDIFALLAGGVFFMHVHGTLNNVTTIETSYRPPNPYDNGWRENWRQMFGKFDVSWFVPIKSKHSASEGVDFPVHVEFLNGPNNNGAMKSSDSLYGGSSPRCSTPIAPASIGRTRS